MLGCGMESQAKPAIDQRKRKLSQALKRNMSRRKQAAQAADERGTQAPGVAKREARA